MEMPRILSRDIEEFVWKKYVSRRKLAQESVRRSIRWIMSNGFLYFHGLLGLLLEKIQSNGLIPSYQGLTVSFCCMNSSRMPSCQLEGEETLYVFQWNHKRKLHSGLIANFQRTRPTHTNAQIAHRQCMNQNISLQILSRPL